MSVEELFNDSLYVEQLNSLGRELPRALSSVALELGVYLPEHFIPTLSMTDELAPSDVTSLAMGLRVGDGSGRQYLVIPTSTIIGYTNSLLDEYHSNNPGGYDSTAAAHDEIIQSIMQASGPSAGESHDLTLRQELKLRMGMPLSDNGYEHALTAKAVKQSMVALTLQSINGLEDGDRQSVFAEFIGRFA
jgi:hypothetical protein